MRYAWERLSMPFAKVGRATRWFRAHTLSAILTCFALDAADAQEPRSIRGTVRGSGSAPLSGATVTALDSLGKSIRSIRTNDSGSFTLIVDSAVSRQTVGVTMVGYQPQQRTLLRASGGAFPRADFTLTAVVSVLPASRTVAQRRRPTRSEHTGDASIGGATSLMSISGDATADLTGNTDDIVAALPFMTVTQTSTGEPALSIFGLGAEQNATTMNGLPFASSLPRGAFGLAVVSSSYDAGKGGFAGAQLSMRLRQGEALSRRTLRVSADGPLTRPSVGPLGRGVDQRQGTGNLMIDGPAIRNRVFYSGNLQLSRRSATRPTLRPDDAGLSAVGIAADSITRLYHLLDSLGIPAARSRAGTTTSDDARLAVRLDFEPSLSEPLAGVTSVNPGSSDDYSLQFGGSSRSTRSAGAGLTTLPAGGLTARHRDGWIQAGASFYTHSNILNETTLGLSGARDELAPNVGGPNAIVRIAADDSTYGPVTVQTAGSTSSTEATTWALALRDRVAWSSFDRRHNPALTLELSRSVYGETADGSNGAFAFSSLAALANGQADRFDRTLDGTRHTAAGWNAAVSLGDVFYPAGPAEALSAPAAIPIIQYGVRVEMARAERAPPLNTELESRLGIRTDARPSSFDVLPMVGFRWPILAPLRLPNGIALERRGMIRGGVRRYVGTLGPQTLASYYRTTGLPDGAQHLSCVGASVPTPDWSGYGQTAGIPTTCLASDTPASTSETAPNVRFLAPGYRPNESWRPELAMGYHLTQTFMIEVNGTYAWNRHVSGFVDRNFDGTPKLHLAAEGNRPVYVSADAIVPQSGLATLTSSRNTTAFTRVDEIRSDLTSTALTLGATLRTAQTLRDANSFGDMALSYAFSDTRRQMYGFNSTAGDPTIRAWGSAPDPRHVVTLSLGRTVSAWGSLSARVRVQSGQRFTPMVDGDINGDGLSNDRAFIFDPAHAGDSVAAAGMQQLLAHGTGAARRCLARQLGGIAGMNSCTGSWSMPIVDLAIAPNSRRLRLGSRMQLNVVVSNIAAGVDQLLHGEQARGWGQPGWSDPVLLRVDGFDPTSQRFRYTVNPLFGSTKRSSAFARQPFRFAIDARIDVGPDRQTLFLRELLRSPDGSVLSADQIKRRLPGGSSPFRALLVSKERLQLSDEQVATITSISQRVSDKRDVLIEDLAVFLESRHGDYDGREVRERWYRTVVEAYGNNVAGTRDALEILSEAQLSQMTTGSLPDVLAIARLRPEEIPARVAVPRVTIP
jgi:hypothetical protein